MESKEHVNPFVDVHKKAEALRKRAREEHEKDAELREKRSEAEIGSMPNDGSQR